MASIYETTVENLNNQITIQEEAEQEGITILDARHRRFAAYLIRGVGAEEAALAMGIGVSTGYRYLSDERVKKYLAQWKDEVASRLVRRLVRHGDEAIEVVAQIMKDEEVAPQTRMQAAFGIMDRLGVDARAARSGDNPQAQIVIEKMVTLINNGAAEAQARRSTSSFGEVYGEYQELGPGGG